MDNFESEGAIQSETSGSIKSLPEPLKVMIVEEESAVAQHICEELLKVGDVIVAVSGSGTEAIEFAKRNQPDIALIDIDIKSDRINSVKTATRLQGLAKSPMLIVFTITYPTSHFPLAGSAEPYVYLNKPFSGDALKSVLHKAAQLKDKDRSAVPKEGKSKPKRIEQ